MSHADCLFDWGFVELIRPLNTSGCQRRPAEDGAPILGGGVEGGRGSDTGEKSDNMQLSKITAVVNNTVGSKRGEKESPC